MDNFVDIPSAIIDIMKPEPIPHAIRPANKGYKLTYESNCSIGKHQYRKDIKVEEELVVIYCLECDYEKIVPKPWWRTDCCVLIKYIEELGDTQKIA